MVDGAAKSPPSATRLQELETLVLCYVDLQMKGVSMLVAVNSVLSSQASSAVEGLDRTESGL